MKGQQQDHPDFLKTQIIVVIFVAIFFIIFARQKSTMNESFRISIYEITVQIYSVIQKQFFLHQFCEEDYVLNYSNTACAGDDQKGAKRFIFTNRELENT